MSVPLSKVVFYKNIQNIFSSKALFNKTSNKIIRNRILTIIDIHQGIKSITIFQKLSTEDIEKILNFSKIVELKKGNIIFYQGDMANNIFILISGAIKIYKSNSKGGEILMSYFYPTSIFAEMPFFEESPYPASAIANINSKVLVIDGIEFRNFIKKNPEILYRFLSSLSKKIKILENRIDNLAVLSGKEKVAKFINQNWNNFKNIKKRVIAESLNITPEHLSRILREFKNLGVISQSGELIEEKRDYFNIC